jgi:TolB-like protein
LGFTQDDVDIIYEIFVTELVSTGKVKVVDRNSFDKIMAEQKFQSSDWSDSEKVASLGRALNANSIVRGQLSKLGEQLLLTVSVLDVNTAQILASSRAQFKTVEEVLTKMNPLAKDIVGKLPPLALENNFIGRWQSNVTHEGKDFRCILEFKTDGTIVIERYDTVGGNLTGTGLYSLGELYNKTILIFTLFLNGSAEHATLKRDNLFYGFDRQKNSFSFSDRDGLLYFNSPRYQVASGYYRTFFRLQ